MSIVNKLWKLDSSAKCGVTYGSTCYFTKKCADLFPFVNANGLKFEFMFTETDILTMPLESFLRQGPHYCEFLLTNLGETTTQVVMGTAMFQQLAMLFEPKGHEQSSPFMLLQVQTNAMPGVEISKGKSNDWLIAVFSLVFGFVILALIMIKMLKKSQQKLQPKEETFSEPNTATALMEDI
jgi:hypothetical protein